MTEPLKVRGFQFLDSDGNGKISRAEIDQRLARSSNVSTETATALCRWKNGTVGTGHTIMTTMMTTTENNPPLSPASGGVSAPRGFFIGLALAALPALLRLLS